MESPEPLLQFFVWAHLPPKLQEISRPFGLLAEQLVATLPRNPERTVALRKLLESKDCAVRSAIWQSVPSGGDKVEEIPASVPVDPGMGFIPKLGD